LLPATPCELIASGFSVTGPTISHHLKVLREAGLIEGHTAGPGSTTKRCL